MIKAIRFGVILMLFSLAGESQAPYFIKVNQDSSGPEGYFDVVKDDSGYTALGSRWGSDGHIYFARLDLNGDTLFTNIHESDSGVWYSALGYKSLMKSPQGYYVCGSVYKDGSSEGILVHVDSYGDTIWWKTTPFDSMGTEIYGMVLSRDSTILCYGASQPAIGYNYKGYVEEFDLSGNSIRSFFLNNTPITSLWGFDTTTTGGFVISGQYNATDPLTTITSMDSTGAFQWGTNFNHPGHESAMVKSVSEGQFILAGGISNNPDSEGFMILCDSVGDSLWSYHRGTDINAMGNIFVDVAEKQNGNFVVLGSIYDYYLEAPIILLLEVDRSGQLVWRRRYQLRNSDHYPMNLELTERDAILISGYVSHVYTPYTPDGFLGYLSCIGYDEPPEAAFEAHQTASDVYFENISQYANYYIWDFGDGEVYEHASDPQEMGSSEEVVHHQYEPGTYVVTLKAIACYDTMIITDTVKIEEKDPSLVVEDPSLDIYPNPTEGELNVLVTTNVPEDASLEIVDIRGRVIFSEEISSSFEHLFIDAGTLSTGVYHAVVRLSSGGIEAKSKFVVQ